MPPLLQALWYLFVDVAQGYLVIPLASLPPVAPRAYGTGHRSTLVPTIASGCIFAAGPVASDHPPLRPSQGLPGDAQLVSHVG